MRRALLLTLATLAACTDRDEFDGTVELFFRPVVSGAYFNCDEMYPGAGAAMKPQDFRMYVTDVRLVTDEGSEHAVELAEDGQFQARGVALLDFEDATGECRGTPALNKTIRGKLSAADQAEHARYTGLRFRIGVPPELDFADPATLPTPLAEPTLRSAVTGGHLFFTAWANFESSTPDTQAFSGVGLDLASDGCLGATCQRSNRPEVVLDNFDLESSTIVVDYNALFAKLDTTVCGTNPVAPCGCWSRQVDSLCLQVLPRLGVDWASGASTAGQVLFRVDG